MKKIILLLTFLSICSYGQNLDKIWKKYEEKKYSEICSKSLDSKEYYKYRNNESFINIFAHSCLETDMINRLALPIVKLRKTEKTRANALYYATVLYQKKLLHHALADGLNIFPTGLPTTNYILSKIYDKFTKKEYNTKGNKYIFKDDDSSKTYELFLRKSSNGYIKLVLRTLKNGKIIKTRLYW